MKQWLLTGKLVSGKHISICENSNYDNDGMLAGKVLVFHLNATLADEVMWDLTH